MIAILLILVLAVIATAAGVLYWFFRRLWRIEEDHWGVKRREAAATAQAEADAAAANADANADAQS
jgi:uncharacterized membrane protein